MSTVPAVPSTETPGTRWELVADCGRCTALCCVALTFARSADFAIDKGAGQPCPNLGADRRCLIHDGLRGAGFGGCVAYDCFGAGQRVTAERRMTAESCWDLDWRRSPEEAATIFARFHTMRGLHELLWYLDEALRLVPSTEEAGELLALRLEVEAQAAAPLEAPEGPESQTLRRRVNERLLLLSAALRAGLGGPDRGRASLLGAKLRKARLQGASFFAACLVGADLREADLRRADLRAADLRGVDLSGADLRGALFLTQSQLESARGDGRSRLPEGRQLPAAWQGSTSR